MSAAPLPQDSEPPASQEDQAALPQGPILVTGFGPFHYHKENASWVAVQELEKLGVVHESTSVPLETREIQVAYEVVSKQIPKLYDDLNPRLCVHVGVSPYTVVKLEKFGKNFGYCGPDVFNCAPSTKMCVPGGPEVIPSRFNVEVVCERLTQKQSDVTVEVSEDAGRYLCDYIYYTSLHMNRAPVVFVHVPELGKPYSALQLGHVLKILIETLLDEL